MSNSQTVKQVIKYLGIEIQNSPKYYNFVLLERSLFFCTFCLRVLCMPILISYFYAVKKQVGLTVLLHISLTKQNRYYEK